MRRRGVGVCKPARRQRPADGGAGGAVVAALLVAVASGALPLAGCRGTRSARGAARGSDAEAAPSGSVVALGVVLGGCEDVAVCARECDGGSADRCRRLAASYASGEGTAQDESLATTLYERACAMGDAPSCVFAGRMREYGHGVPEDAGAALALYERACDERWLAGCYNVAFLLERGRGVPRDVRRAAELYAAACAAGAQPACERASALADAGLARGAASGGD